MKGFFGDLFDFDHDGELSPVERAADFTAFQEVMNSMDVAEPDSFDELEAVGLNRDELEWMDEDERREILEDAGLDSDDFDF